MNYRARLDATSEAVDVAALARINELEAEIAARNKALSPLACWWAMVEAQAELSEDGPIPPDAVVLHFMGSGASTQLTAQQMRDALLPDNAGGKPLSETKSD